MGERGGGGGGERQTESEADRGINRKMYKERDRKIEDKLIDLFVCLFVWFLNVLVNY